jgi:hypothetical protein
VGARDHYRTQLRTTAGQRDRVPKLMTNRTGSKSRPLAGIRTRSLGRVAGSAGLMNAPAGHRAGFRLVSRG